MPMAMPAVVARDDGGITAGVWRVRRRFGQCGSMAVRRVLMVPEVAHRCIRLVDAVARHHRPGRLGRQQYEQKNGEPAAHRKSVAVTM